MGNTCHCLEVFNSSSVMGVIGHHIKKDTFIVVGIGRTAVSGHSRRDALCARRDGGGEGYDAGLEGESGDDEELWEERNAVRLVLTGENVYR